MRATGAARSRIFRWGTRIFFAVAILVALFLSGDSICHAGWGPDAHFEWAGDNTKCPLGYFLAPGD